MKIDYEKQNIFYSNVFLIIMPSSRRNFNPYLIAGNRVTSLIRRPGAAEDGKAPVWDQATKKWEPGGSGAGSLQRVVVTVAAAALRACGSVPVAIIPAPGANKYLSIQAIGVSYKAGVVPFDFLVSPGFKTVTIVGLQFFLGVDLNTIVSKNFDLVKQGQDQAVNQAFVLTTEDGTDATTGDGDIDIVVYYSVEDVNV